LQEAGTKVTRERESKGEEIAISEAGSWSGSDGVAPESAGLAAGAGEAGPDVSDTPSHSPSLGTRRNLLEGGQTVRYSRFVGRAKVILPSVAGALIVAVAMWPYLPLSLEKLKPFFLKLDIAQLRDQKMINPRYTGVDKDRRPFTVTADAGRQNSSDANGDDNLVALDGPKADILTKEGAWVVVTGDTGIYQAQTHFLDLFGHVTLFHDKGYEFKTSSARVDLDTSTAEGHEPITGDGPSGTVSGEGFRVLQKGDIVIFTGKNHLVLDRIHDDGN
jgi:lipopolysaccharide export system protein LptC